MVVVPSVEYSRMMVWGELARELVAEVAHRVVGFDQTLVVAHLFELFGPLRTAPRLRCQAVRAREEK